MNHYCYDRALGEMIACSYLSGNGGFCGDRMRDKAPYAPCAWISPEAVCARQDGKAAAFQREGLPGTINGLLRRGAPVGIGMDREPATVVAVYAAGARVATSTEPAMNHTYTWASLHLDLSDPVGRDVALRWLLSGEHTDGALPCGCGKWSRFVGGTDADPEPACDACNARPVYGGWTRKPFPNAAWMGDLHHDVLTAEQSADAIAWSVRSVVAGGEPLVGFMTAWTRFEKSENTIYSGDDGTYAHAGWGRQAGYIDSGLRRLNSGIYAEVDDRAGWRICMGTRGIEAGEAGKATADERLLSYGLALLRQDRTLRLPEIRARYTVAEDP